MFGDSTGTLATGFSGSATSKGAFDLLQGLESDNPTLPNGFSFGVIKQGIKIGGITFPNIGAILRAYKNDADINIISTPQILTTDNKKAEISVGENVPYITSQNTTASQQDYTQYEYKDVATKLTITPQINQGDTLRLDIKTEVVKLKSASETLTPTTFTRTASTTVIVNDDDTVVIGGIIGEDTNLGNTQVPLLGDIPILGWLFRSKSNADNKTNMFIFVTPKIIRNPADIAAVTLSKRENMTGLLPGAKEALHRKVNPTHAMKLTEEGYGKLVADKLDEAKQYFRKALQIDPKNAYALLDMGVVSERQGAYSEAMRYYQAVITVDTKAAAVEASNEEKRGLPLVEIARQNIERLRHEMSTKK